MVPEGLEGPERRPETNAWSDAMACSPGSCRGTYRPSLPSALDITEKTAQWSQAASVKSPWLGVRQTFCESSSITYWPWDAETVT